MMDANERETALQRMDRAVSRFYSEATQIGVHPFIEFAGVMAAYAKSCRRAHEAGVDFSECNRHSGRLLPVEEFELDYLNEVSVAPRPHCRAVRARARSGDGAPLGGVHLIH